MKLASLVLTLIDQAYEMPAWHGPNLKQSIRGVTAKQAAWRPGPGRHNIWEETLHAAYWKYVVRRKLEGGKRGSFSLKGSNFFPRPEKGKLTIEGLEASDPSGRVELRVMRVFASEIGDQDICVEHRYGHSRRSSSK